jgi:hypothetical protein
VLKEVANIKVFTTLDFWGTHEGNLEMDDTNEACMFDEASQYCKRSIEWKSTLSMKMFSLLSLLLLAWFAV